MKKKNNILILMADQLRADSLSCAGHPQVKTPNIDKICEKGTIFNNTFTTTPVCMPARTSFANGLYPHNTGMWENTGEMLPDDETYFQILKEDGYYNAHIGKAHYYVHKPGLHMKDREDYMHARGFDYICETTGNWGAMWTDSYMTDQWKENGVYDKFIEDYNERSKNRVSYKPSPLPEDDYFDGFVGKRSVEFINDYDFSKPLCLFVGFPGPHEPWDAPGKYATMYDPEEAPEPIPYAPPPESLEDVKDLKLTNEILENHKEITREDINNIRASYYGNVSLIDHWVGEILNAFEEKGELDDLLIVLWSDHGEMLGDHGRLYKCTFHESSVKVPLIISKPGIIPQGKANDSLVETIDVFPTILELVGSKPSDRSLGKSFTDAFEKQDYEHRDNVLSEICFYDGNKRYMLRNQRYKYAVNENGRSFMLFDLVDDPEEQKNLIGTEKGKEIEPKMREELFKRIIKSQYSMAQDTNFDFDDFL